MVYFETSPTPANRASGHPLFVGHDIKERVRANECALLHAFDVVEMTETG